MCLHRVSSRLNRDLSHSSLFFPSLPHHDIFPQHEKIMDREKKYIRFWITENMLCLAGFFVVFLYIILLLILWTLSIFLVAYSCLFIALWAAWQFIASNSAALTMDFTLHLLLFSLVWNSHYFHLLRFFSSFVYRRYSLEGCRWQREKYEKLCFARRLLHHNRFRRHDRTQFNFSQS